MQMPAKGSQRFPKAQRLCSRLLLDAVFHQGKSFAKHPVRVLFLESNLPEDVPTQVVMSVPKRRIRKAADRNHIKRLMREAWRKNKPAFDAQLKTTGKQMAVMLIYTGKAKPKYAVIDEKIILILQRLMKEGEAISVS